MCEINNQMYHPAFKKQLTFSTIVGRYINDTHMHYLESSSLVISMQLCTDEKLDIQIFSLYGYVVQMTSISVDIIIMWWPIYSHVQIYILVVEYQHSTLFEVTVMVIVSWG